ncbi:DDE-type integrase/transposase/recombinase [Patescibacteria group bacterium]|nr:DDE-type integrase/transposase/recombinase [Patescibacteria group bacterium]
MITPKAQRKYSALIFWEKHGWNAALDYAKVSRRTLFLWKSQLRKGNGKPEALNEKSKAPRKRRIRQWPEELKAAIRQIRSDHPNLGKAKIRKILEKSRLNQLPSVSTIGRLIKDLGGLRIYPQKVLHSGKVKQCGRKKILRKPKNFQTTHPGHLVALDTIERFINGCRRYIITFEDIHSRFAFAWSTTSHASKAAQEFFDLCRIVFPVPIDNVLTDNGSEFKKHFSQALEKLYLRHYHTYPKTPKMNSHCERLNRTIQEEFVDFNVHELLEPAKFNRKLMNWLIWYNTERPHYGLNLQTPLEFLLTWFSKQQECNYGWTDTFFFIMKKILLK